jgi:hypothetical protein
MWNWLLPAVTAGFGIFSGIFGKNQQAREEQAALEQQKKTAWEQYELGKAYSGQQYGIQERQAYSDLAVQERRAGEGLARSMGDLNTGLLGQAYGIQAARIQTASSAGASLAAEGMGGTRGNEANSLMRAYEQTSFDRSVSLQSRQNESAVNALGAQAADAREDISRERESWKEGGYRYEQKAAQDAYNLKTAELGQKNFDWAIEQAAPTALDYLSGAFEGVSSGLAFGSGIDSYSKDWFGNSVGGFVGTGLGNLFDKLSGYTRYRPSNGANSNKYLKDAWW